VAAASAVAFAEWLIDKYENVDAPLASISYSPYTRSQHPDYGDRPTAAQIRADLKILSPYTHSIRTYSATGVSLTDDPDTHIRKHGKEAFEARVREAETLSQFLLAQLRADNDLATAEGRARFGQRVHADGREKNVGPAADDGERRQQDLPAPGEVEAVAGEPRHLPAAEEERRHEDGDEHHLDDGDDPRKRAEGRPQHALGRRGDDLLVALAPPSGVR